MHAEIKCDDSTWQAHCYCGTASTNKRLLSEAAAVTGEREKARVAACVLPERELYIHVQYIQVCREDITC